MVLSPGVIHSMSSAMSFGPPSRSLARKACYAAWVAALFSEADIGILLIVLIDSLKSRAGASVKRGAFMLVQSGYVAAAGAPAAATPAQAAPATLPHRT